MDQGFAPTDGLKAMRKQVPHESPITATRGALRGPKPVTGEDKALAVAQGVRTTANLPFMLMLPALPMAALGWVAGKLKRDRTATVLGGGSRAMMDGMRQTKIENFLHTPATMVDMVADKAAEVGGRAQGWEAPLRARSEAIRGGADKLGAGLNKLIAPVRSLVGSGLEKVNLKQPVKAGLTRIGKLPVGAAVATVAATAGVTAIWLTRSKASKEHVQTVADMRKVFGENSPIVAEATKIYSKDKSRSVIGSALESANEALFVGFEAMPALGGSAFVGMMAGQMGLQSAQQMFVSENPIADAFKGLQMAQRGEIQVPKEQQAFWFQVIIGSTPEAQAKGGSRNRLAAAMGKELAQQGTTLDQFAEILGDKAKFTALATTATEKMDAAKAAKASHQPAAKETHTPTASPSHTQPTMLAAGPAAKVSGIAHQGMLHSQQLASAR